ncbi:MAG: hypothetical protein DRP71_17365 [Verrucomicrobia bacterium]|nr:MAG: hypothetical protein DRP71_17365 [Verrucomicrobiota bacterium]
MILALNHPVWKLRLTPDILAIAIFPESPTGTMFRPAIFRKQLRPLRNGNFQYYGGKITTWQ